MELRETLGVLEGGSVLICLGEFRPTSGKTDSLLQSTS